MQLDVAAARGCLAVSIASIAVAGCGGEIAGERFTGFERLDQFIDADARLLFVGAHPDDETLAGPILAKACIVRGVDCHIAVFTRGESGMCGLIESECGDLGARRAEEMQRVAVRYNATLHQAAFSNGPSNAPTDDDRVDEILLRWQSEGSPRGWLAGVLFAVQPDVVITLDRDNGFTGHFEHRLASRLTTDAVHSGAAPPHTRIFHVLNHYEALEPLTGRDPAKATQTWHLQQPCRDSTCLDVAVEIAMLHASQASSILALLLLFPDEFELGFLRLNP